MWRAIRHHPPLSFFQKIGYAPAAEAAPRQCQRHARPPAASRTRRVRDAREIFSLANKISYVCSLSLLLTLAPGFLSSITSITETVLRTVSIVVNLTRYPVRAGLTSLLCNRLEVSSDIVLTRNLWLDICTLSLGIDVSSRVHRQTIVLLFITAFVVYYCKGPITKLFKWGEGES